MEHCPQKKREREHLERFRNACPAFPAGDITETEEPDFIVATLSGNVGIEHTDFHLDDARPGGSPLRAQETLRRQVVSSALSRHESRQLPIVDVLLTWSGQHNLTPRRVKQLTPVLADFVEEHMPGSNQVARIKYPADGWESLPAEITSVRIARFDVLTDNHWDFVRSGWTPSLKPDALSAVIAKKEPKIPTYRQSCREVWLLIVAHGFHESSFSELSDETRGHEFATAFDRIFFFRYFDGDAVELMLRRAES